MRFSLFLISSIFFCIFLTSSNHSFFKKTLNPGNDKNNQDVIETSWVNTDAFRRYLEDSEDRVSDKFKISPFFYPSVHFWFLIYTQFSSNVVVVHDKSDLSIIYKIYNFSKVKKDSIPKKNLKLFQQKFSGEKVSILKNDFDELIKNPFNNSNSSEEIFRAIKQSNTKLPKNKNQRIALLKKLKMNLRTQTGQKNFINEGLGRFYPFKYFLTSYFKNLKLPTELLALPFLESSFNPMARSRVNALGVWQIMPLTSSYYIPKRTIDFDYRSNIGISSLAAAFLILENYTILKSWDLAITAYNSGTRHLVKTIKSLKKRNVDLETIIKHGSSKYFGFASKNFYSEFLALIHALAYHQDFYEEAVPAVDLKNNLKFFMAKCSLNISSIFKKNELNDIYHYNHHTSNKLKVLPKGFILTTNKILSSNFFYEVPKEILLKRKPKNWMQLLNSQSCSTR